MPFTLHYMLGFLRIILGSSGATQLDFSAGMQEFVSYITSLVSVWTTVIAQILNSANWILLIPIFSYVFVVATSSLRSFYKG